MQVLVPVLALLVLVEQPPERARRLLVGLVLQVVVLGLVLVLLASPRTLVLGLLGHVLLGLLLVEVYCGQGTRQGTIRARNQARDASGAVGSVLVIVPYIVLLLFRLALVVGPVP